MVCVGGGGRGVRGIVGSGAVTMRGLMIHSLIYFIFFKCNRTIGSRSIGHRVWSMSLNTLTELSVN